MVTPVAIFVGCVMSTSDTNALVMMLSCGHTLSLKSRQLKIGEQQLCRTCYTEAIVKHVVERWTIRCIHIEHSMTRTYGVNKEYAWDRALAHTRKYGRAHLCIVYQKANFDDTMKVVNPDAGQTVIDVDEEYREVDPIKKAIGVFKEVFETVEEIPY